MFNGKDVGNLKGIASKANPSTQRYMAKKIDCSPAYINKLVNKDLNLNKRIKIKVDGPVPLHCTKN